MKNKFFISLTFLSMVLIVSCEGPQGEVGPQGPQGESYDPFKEWNYKEGSITATATGTRLDGTNYSYNLNYQGNYSGADNSYTVLSPTETAISISKVAAGDGDAVVYGEMSMYITVTSLEDLSSPVLDNMSVDWTKDLGDDTYHQTYYYWYTGYPNATATISNLAYNSTTEVLTGNFTFTGNASSEQGNVSITNGTFSTKLSKMVAKTAVK